MSLGCLCCNIMPFNALKTLDNYMYICSINLVEHRFFEPSWAKQIGANYREVWKIEGKHTVFDWWRKVKFGSNYRKPRVQDRGGSVCTEAINYNWLILTFRQLTIKRIILEKVIQVLSSFFIVILSLCRVFKGDFQKFRRSLLMKG